MSYIEQRREEFQNTDEARHVKSTLPIPIHMRKKERGIHNERHVSTALALRLKFNENTPPVREALMRASVSEFVGLM